MGLLSKPVAPEEVDNVVQSSETSKGILKVGSRSISVSKSVDASVPQLQPNRGSDTSSTGSVGSGGSGPGKKQRYKK
jgi:hypothetical protein